MTSLRPVSTVDVKRQLELAKLMDFSDLVNFDEWEGDFRQKVLAIENRLMLLPEVPFRYEHMFHDGIYMRTIYAPANTLMTSYIYTKPHICVISKGDVSYKSEVFGGRITGPAMFNANAGSKRIVFCHTDLVWTTVIKTDATNVQDAEKDIFISTYEEWDSRQCDNIILVGG